MYTDFLSSLTAVFFPHLFASSLFLIFVALYQADGYAASLFFHLFLESHFPTFKQACYFVHARCQYHVYFCGFGYVMLCRSFTIFSVQTPFDRPLFFGRCVECTRH